MTAHGTRLGLISDALSLTRKSISQDAANLALKNVDEASAKELNTTPVISGNTITGLKASIHRLYDATAKNTISSYKAESQYYDTVKGMLSDIQDVIGNIDGMDVGKLVKPISDFFSTLNTSINLSSQSISKNLIVDQARNICENFNQIISIALNTKINSQKILEEKVDQANNDIALIYDLNQKVINATLMDNNAADLMDERDRAVARLNDIIPVTVSQSKYNGIILKSLTHSIVSETTYSKLSFDRAINLEDVLDNEKSNPINIEFYNSIGSVTKRIRYHDATSEREKKGQLNALIDCYENDIPRVIKSIDALAQNFITEINKIHNKGSGYPGYSSLVGERKISGGESIEWLGSAFINIIDDKGMALRDSSGTAVPQMKLFLDKLKSNNSDSVPRVRDIINEINNFYSPTETMNNSMGLQHESTNKYLMRDFKLAISSKNSSILEFDFEASNSSDFGSKIQVLSASIDGNEIDVNSEVLNLSPGAKERSFKSSIINLANLHGEQNLDLKIRVVGEDGQIKTGKIRFVIDMDNIPEVNSRVSGVRMAGADGGDIIDPPTTLGHGKVLRAYLADEYGSEIKSDSQEGFLKIEVYDQNYRFMIDDNSSQQITSSSLISTKNGFGHYFGMNNLFHEDFKPSRIAYSMKVRNEIISNPNLLSTSKALKAEKYQAEFLVGDGRASRKINFTDNNPANYLNSTLKILGITYILTNNKLNVNDIDISAAGNFQSMMDIINDNLNQDKRISEVLTFSYNENVFDIQSKVAGTGSNSIEIEFANASHATFNNLNSTGNLKLMGGSNKRVMLEKNKSGFVIAESGTELISDMLHLADYGSYLKGNEYVQDSFSTLFRYAVIVTDVITSNYIRISDRADVSTKASERLKLDYIEKYGVNNDKVWNDVMMKQSHFAAVAKLLNLLIRIDRELNENLG